MRLNPLDIVFVNDDPTPYEIEVCITYHKNRVRMYRIRDAETKEHMGIIMEEDITDYIPYRVDQNLLNSGQEDDFDDEYGMRDMLHDLVDELAEDPALSEELKQYKHVLITKLTSIGTITIKIDLENGSTTGNT